MAQSTNETKARLGILPDAELNPLVNPLLAAHMGRWAEVYFTSPPEKRAQAVSDLVRELSNDSSSPVSAPSASAEARWPKVEDEAADVPSPSSASKSEQPLVQCESCGHQNAVPQRFCGMCGAPLTSSLEPLQPFEEPEPIAATHWHETDNVRHNVGEREVEPPLVSAHPSTDYRATLNSPWPPPENAPAEFTMLSEYQSEPDQHPYRIYVGLVVAIVLGLLVYVTWRNNSAFWSSGGAPAALPQAVPPAKSEAPRAAAAQPPATSAEPNNTTSKPAEAAPIRSAAPSQNRTGVPSENDRGVKNQHPQQVARTRPVTHAVPATQNPSAANPATDMAGQNGSEELAAAEKYLNAGPGGARDSQQAAMLLWKAVAKQNLTATLLLSDLYLRGDGVSKSCDQARLLLDAAARKGAAAAAERLRNLQAFGCR
ncbi:MAG: zinc ribbon domain-containing protein [Candidatus Sulfotelmatobacter sp.]